MPRQSLPTISVSKPPVPLPVDLPTPDTLEPDSSHTSMNSSEADLEAGVGMREMHGEYAGISTTPSRPEASHARDITPTGTGPALVSLASPPAPASAFKLQTPPPKSGVAAQAQMQMRDLLSDSEPNSHGDIAGIAGAGAQGALSESPTFPEGGAQDAAREKAHKRI